MATPPPPSVPPMSAALAPPPLPDTDALDGAAHPVPGGPGAPRLLMTRAEFHAAAETPATAFEWLGDSGETRGGEPLGVVWPRFGYDPDGTRAMAEENHGIVVMNLIAEVLPQIDRDEWRLLTQDAEVGCPTGRVRLPDLVLAEEPAEYAPHPEGRNRLLLNAKIAVEVLSPSTRAVDLGDKPADYLSIPTLTDYVVVDPRRPWVQHRRRADAAPGRWAVTTHEDPAAALEIEEPALTVPLSAIYARVPTGGG